MSFGIQVYNSNGNLTLDLSRRISRVLAVIGPITSNGSQVVQGINTGTPYTFTKLTAEPYRVAIEVTINPSTQRVSWVYSKISMWNVTASAYIVVGVY